MVPITHASLTVAQEDENKPKRGRGRPPKNTSLQNQTINNPPEHKEIPTRSLRGRTVKSNDLAVVVLGKQTAPAKKKTRRQTIGPNEIKRMLVGISNFAPRKIRLSTNEESKSSGTSKLTENQIVQIEPPPPPPDQFDLPQTSRRLTTSRKRKLSEVNAESTTVVVVESAINLNGNLRQLFVFFLFFFVDLCKE